jgi:hypothetical protein
VQTDASETGAFRITDGSDVTTIQPSSASFAGSVTATQLITANSGINVNTANLNVGSGNFTVAPATGNTNISGTLGVTGQATLGDADIDRLVGALNANSQAITNVNIDNGDIANGVVINKSPTVNFNAGDVRGSLTLSQLASGTGSLNIEPGAVAGTELNSSVAGTGLSGGGGSALSVNLGTGLQFNGDDIEANLSAIAGDGLADNSGALDLDIDGLANTVNSVQNADLLAIYDDSGSDEVSITRQDFIESAPIGNINIDGGNIDGATIATSDITVGSGRTLDVSLGSLTLANDQISGDKVSGGTIGSATLDGATFTTSTLFQTDLVFDESNDLTLAAADQVSGTATLTIPDLGGTDGDMVVSNATQTLSNKTLSSNTVATTQAPGTNNTSVATTAFVTDAVSTGVSGAANNVAIYDGSGDLTAEAQLATSRGGTGQDLSASTGILRVNAGTVSAGSDIVDSDISGSADITRTKLAPGTASHVLVNDGTGEVSSEAQLNPIRGGTGVNNGANTITLGGNINTASSFTTVGANTLTLTTSGATDVTLPTTGTLATLSGTETLTNKTVVDNSFAIADAGSGFNVTFVMSLSSNRIFGFPNEGGLLSTTAGSQTLSNKTIDADDNSISNISNTEISATADIEVTKLADPGAGDFVLSSSGGTISWQAWDGVSPVTSDIRLKKDLTPIKSPLKRLQDVEGYNYYWKESTDTTLQYGVMAQELEAIFPTMVVEGADGIKRVKYTSLIPVLIEALKEQQAIIENLQAKLDDEKVSKEDLKAAFDKQKELMDLQAAAMLSLQEENYSMKSDIDSIKKALGLELEASTDK